MKRRKQTIPPLTTKENPDTTPTVTTTRRVELTFPRCMPSIYGGYHDKTFYLSSPEARVLAASLLVGADAVDKEMP